MSSMLITNIKTLYGITEPGTLIKKGAQMQEVKTLDNAWLLIEDGLIRDHGSMDKLPRTGNVPELDCLGGLVLPCFVDSHTHIVFAKSREEEFIMRVKGMSYEQIAEAGGGILNSAKRLHETSEDELLVSALLRLQEVIATGTGAIEIKSGYGLSTEDELKMLRVIKRLKEMSPIPVKATFLGAHAIPAQYKGNREAYIRLVIEEMLPKIEAENLADYIDVFCDKGFFTPEETERIILAGAKHGLKARIHANELGLTGGVQVATRLNAISADHLEHCGDEEISCFKNSSTIPTALPNCSFFLGIPYAPARKIINSGLPLCLASDYNPGTSPSGKMGFVLALACIHMKLSPEEALNACTLNGAAALEIAATHGSIERGKAGNVIITRNIPSLNYIPYAYNSQWIDKVVISGNVVNG